MEILLSGKNREDSFVANSEDVESGYSLEISGDVQFPILRAFKRCSILTVGSSNCVNERQYVDRLISPQIDRRAD